MSNLTHDRTLSPTRPHTPPRVLLVDDDPDFTAIIREVLIAPPLKCRVRIADSAQEALVYLNAANPSRERRPNIIFTDLDMPGMTGDEFLQTLKADPEFSDLPVIVMSAHPETQRHRQLLNAGAARFISKLEEPRNLFEAVRQAVMVS